MKNSTIICYGDSNTYGYDPRTGSTGRYEKNTRWTGILEQQLDFKIENHGICGRCIPHTVSQLNFVREQVLGWKQRDESIWMWVMLGTNDLLQEETFSAEQAAARMEEFLCQLLEETGGSSGKMKFLLISPAQMQYGSWVNEERLIRESQRLGSEYQKVAQKLGILFADAGEWDIPVLFDGVHFSEEGHKNFAQSLLDQITQQKQTDVLYG